MVARLRRFPTGSAAVTTPHDEAAERAVVGHLLATHKVHPDLAQLITPADLWSPYLRAIAEACWDLTGQAKPCDPVAVHAELRRRGDRGEYVNAVHLVGVMQDAAIGASALFHARRLRDIAVRRAVILEATRAVQQAENPALDPYDIAATLVTSATVLAERSDPLAVPSLTDVHDFLAGQDEYDWAIPRLFERGDRFLITAGEGGGKSVWQRQVAVCAAAGIHPFGGRPFTPLRVLFVDLENGARALRRALAPLLTIAHGMGKPVPRGNLWLESRPSGIDLTRPDDEQWLSRVCEAAQPELLVIGPLYRMHAQDMNKEEPARHLTAVIDRIRARHNCVVTIETHSPHAFGNGPRNLRPVGASLFLRWPEFGYGISQNPDLEATYDMRPWRGPRDERSWPHQLRWGIAGEWPWMPVQTLSQWSASRAAS